MSEKFSVFRRYSRFFDQVVSLSRANPNSFDLKAFIGHEFFILIMMFLPPKCP